MTEERQVAANENTRLQLANAQLTAKARELVVKVRTEISQRDAEIVKLKGNQAAEAERDSLKSEIQTLRESVRTLERTRAPLSSPQKHPTLNGGDEDALLQDIRRAIQELVSASNTNSSNKILQAMMSVARVVKGCLEEQKKRELGRSPQESERIKALERDTLMTLTALAQIVRSQALAKGNVAQSSKIEGLCATLSDQIIRLLEITKKPGPEIAKNDEEGRPYSNADLNRQVSLVVEAIRRFVNVAKTPTKSQGDHLAATDYLLSVSSEFQLISARCYTQKMDVAQGHLSSATSTLCAMRDSLSEGKSKPTLEQVAALSVELGKSTKDVAAIVFPKQPIPAGPISAPPKKHENESGEWRAVAMESVSKLEQKSSDHQRLRERYDVLADDFNRLRGKMHNLEFELKKERDLYARLRADYDNLGEKCLGLEAEIRGKTSYHEIVQKRVEKEKDLLKIEYEKKAKEDEKVRNVKMEIWKLEEAITLNPSRRGELEPKIAKRKTGLKALEQGVDATPPNWNASWPSVGATVYHHQLDSVTLQLDRKSYSEANTILSITEKPFGKGSFRLAHYGKDGGQRMVFKKLIFSQDFEADRKEHEENLKLHLIANYFAETFNRRKPQDTPTLKYVRAKIYKYRDHGVETCVFGEEVLDGQFTKYNSNGEFVNQDPEAALPQTFSHFTYIHSGGRLVICDLQGSYSPARREFILTDPACHKLASRGEAREFGDSNLGEKGLSQFFISHQCNQFCRAMGLTPHPSQKK